MKDGIYKIISKEEAEWLSKNTNKNMETFFDCKDCPICFLKTRRNISCIELLEKIFGINPNIGCSEINRIIYDFFNRNRNRNKI